MEVMCDEMGSGRMHVRLTQGLGDRVELAAEVEARTLNREEFLAGGQLALKVPDAAIPEAAMAANE